MLRFDLDTHNGKAQRICTKPPNHGIKLLDCTEVLPHHRWRKAILVLRTQFCAASAANKNYWFAAAKPCCLRFSLLGVAVTFMLLAVVKACAELWPEETWWIHLIGRKKCKKYRFIFTEEESQNRVWVACNLYLLYTGFQPVEADNVIKSVLPGSSRILSCRHMQASVVGFSGRNDIPLILRRENRERCIAPDWHELRSIHRTVG